MAQTITRIHWSQGTLRHPQPHVSISLSRGKARTTLSIMPSSLRRETPQHLPQHPGRTFLLTQLAPIATRSMLTRYLSAWQSHYLRSALMCPLMPPRRTVIPLYLTKFSPVWHHQPSQLPKSTSLLMERPQQKCARYPPITRSFAGTLCHICFCVQVGRSLPLHDSQG